MAMFIVGVMGGGEGTSAEICRQAYTLGSLIAKEGWVLLNGGRVAGVMGASARGAREAGGLTVGILPGKDLMGASPHVDIPIVTGLGDARNYINILSSSVVVVLPGGAGTLSEAALALKNGKTIITLGFPLPEVLGEYMKKDRVLTASSPKEVILLIKSRFNFEL
jgi:uncharacterized protein (TIGR00725 family)